MSTNTCPHCRQTAFTQDAAASSTISKHAAFSEITWSCLYLLYYREVCSCVCNTCNKSKFVSQLHTSFLLHSLRFLHWCKSVVSLELSESHLNITDVITASGLRWFQMWTTCFSLDPHMSQRASKTFIRKEKQGNCGCSWWSVTYISQALFWGTGLTQRPDCESRQTQCNQSHRCRTTDWLFSVFSVEEDPDYDFLHKDLSSSETLPPLPAPSSLPPALPEKRRHSTTGNTCLCLSIHLSVCSSVCLTICCLWTSGTTNSQTPPNFEFNSTSKDESPACCDDIIDPDVPLSSPLSPSKTPPPLPEKKRHSE